MEFALSDNQIMLQSTLRKALSDCVSIENIRSTVDQNLHQNDTIYRLLQEMGIPALLVPEQYGGLNMSLLDAALVAEELGRACAATPYFAATVLAPLALLEMGSAVQQQTWLPAIAKGEQRLGVAITSLMSGQRSSKGLTAKNNILNGYTAFVIDGHEADGFIVGCQQQLYLVQANAAGLTLQEQHMIDGTRPCVALALDNTPAELLTNSNSHAIERLQDAAWIIQAADTLGAAWQMIDASVEYAQIRKQFGRLIGSFQAVKHMCAEMAAEIEPGRSLVWYAANAFDQQLEEASLYACHAKALLNDAGHFVARTATEVHGGIGITDDLGLHYWFKRIATNRKLLGSPQDARLRAAHLQGFC